MKLFVSAGFGFALALSAYALSGTPASALQAPAVAAVSQNGIVKVDDNWRERLRWHKLRERCKRVHYKCSKRYGGIAAYSTNASCGAAARGNRIGQAM